MIRNRENQSGFGAIEVVLIVMVIAVVGFGGWYVYQKQKKNDQQKNNTNTTQNNANNNSNPKPSDPNESWKKVSTLGGALSIKVPDGWSLINLPGNALIGDDITFTAGKPAVITNATEPYTGHQKKLTIGYTENLEAEDEPPQWESPNKFGTETKSDFYIGTLKGTRYSIEFTETVTGVTKGEKLYQYVFELPGKRFGVVYHQYPTDADNLETVEQAIKTIVVN